MIRLLGAILLVVSTIPPWSSRASAQERAPAILVLPTSVGAADERLLAARAESVAGALAGGQPAALSLSGARTRFEEMGSAEPPQLSASDIERWTSLSRDAVRALARADYDGATRALLEAQALTDRAREELSRETVRARQVLDTCLYEVRALIETHDPRAEPRATECRRQVPRVDPSPYVHTPEVVALFDRVTQQLAESAPATLRVESEPSSCALRMNGVEFGVTPFVAEDLFPGDYRLQVECEAGMRGRVHRVRVASGSATVRIDARFDAVVRSDTVLRLAYPDLTAAARRLEDSVRVGELVGASEVWLLALDGSSLRIDRVDVASRRVLASVLTGAEDLVGATASLRAGRSEDRTGGQVRSMERWAPEPVEEIAVGEGGTDPGAGTGTTTASRGPDGVAIGLGVALGIVGIGGFVASWAFYDWRIAGGEFFLLADPMDTDYLTRQQVWLDRRWPAWFSSWGGALLTTVSLPLLMHEHPGVPWWSWMLATVGAGIAAVGIVEMVIANPCDGTALQNRSCVERAAELDRGILISSMAIPFLAVPVVYAMRDTTAGARPGITILRDGVYVEMSGTF